MLTLSFKKMYLKVSTAKWRPFCQGLNVLKTYILLFLHISIYEWENHISYISVKQPRLIGMTLQWYYNGRDGVSNPRRLACLLNSLFRRRSEKTSKLRVTGLCEGNSPVTGEFPAQRASNADNVSIWWRHHDNDVGNFLNSLRSGDAYMRR